jgi:hypothetical protein
MFFHEMVDFIYETSSISDATLARLIRTHHKAELIGMRMRKIIKWSEPLYSMYQINS